VEPQPEPTEYEHEQGSERRQEEDAKTGAGHDDPDRTEEEE
jgi:hypothetical protein